MQLFNSQSLSQRTSVVVNAQLQQAIHLLAMGNTDLAAYIEAQAEENPFVELGSHAAPRPAPAARGAQSEDWDQIGALAADPGPSLYIHVAAEIARLDLAPHERAAASVFLDALEPSGWLGQPLEQIAASAALTQEEAEALLTKLQGIEPAGIFARSLAECLRLQAAEQGVLCPRLEVILDNLPMLAAADLRGLARLCDCSLAAVKTSLRALRGLNPKPGTLFESAPIPERAPDLLVTRGEEGCWQIDLNRSTLPRVLVRAQEAQEISQGAGNGSETGSYVGERLSLAHWLARAVEHRNHTILKVGAEVMRRQQDFLEHGAAQMKPMILREVADAIGVHESTVSRVTTGMLVQTPQGTLPLKSFFSAALSSSKGEDSGSAAAVRHRIKQLVQAESPDAPLSDEEIAKTISGEGTILARRTVAKYREMLRIPSSTARRRRAALQGQI